MKIFLDTANLDEIREAAALGVVDGVTTNPSLLAKETGDPEAILVFSMESYGGARAEVLDPDYKPVEDRRACLASRADRLVTVTRGFSRFLR